MNMFEELTAARVEMKERRQAQDRAHEQYRAACELAHQAHTRYWKALEAIEKEAAVLADDLPEEHAGVVAKGRDA